MKLDHIPLDRLYVDKTNMRFGRKAPDVSDILPTIRARGVIQSLLVRPPPIPKAVSASSLEAAASTQAVSPPTNGGTRAISIPTRCSCLARSWRMATMPPPSKPR
ncbi:hypothetical protein [Sphingobium sp. PAMC28499]|uniref:hypothetical protein n=1 Tax=Sphingobium sp. PAMC28499 TaxID=2565554 RepID=UPI001B351EFE